MFARKEAKAPDTPERSPLLDEQTDTSPQLRATKKSGTISRVRPRLIRNRRKSASPGKRPGSSEDKQLGPLTINADQMSDSDIEQIFNDAQHSGQELQIRDNNGKVTYKTIGYLSIIGYLSFNCTGGK